MLQSVRKCDILIMYQRGKQRKVRVANMFNDSDVLYVCSVVECPILDIAKAHVVDDFCNEYVVTINMHNNTVLKGYVKPSDLDIIDCIKYDRHDYDMLLGNAGYEHSLNVI